MVIFGSSLIPKQFYGWLRKFTRNLLHWDIFLIFLCVCFFFILFYLFCWFLLSQSFPYSCDFKSFMVMCLLFIEAIKFILHNENTLSFNTFLHSTNNMWTQHIHLCRKPEQFPISLTLYIENIFISIYIIKTWFRVLKWRFKYFWKYSTWDTTCALNLCYVVNKTK